MNQSQPTTETLPAKNRIKTANGNDYISILHLEEMAPFFISLISDSDVWAFISSTGALSAGRGNPEKAFFPYYTVDKIHDSYGITGPVTLIRLPSGEHWEPFDPKAILSPSNSRYLDKSISGNILRFGEDNNPSGLSFSTSWKISNRFGLTRTACLKNNSAAPQTLSLVDGIKNLVPPGVGTIMQSQFSCLSESYNKNELLANSRLGLFAMNAGIIDQPIPLESLQANIVWTCGLPDADVLLDGDTPNRFRKGCPLHARHEQRGERGSYFLHSEITLAAGEEIEWTMVIDGPKSGTEVSNLYETLLADEHAVCAELADDLEQGKNYIQRLLSNCDAFQKTSDSILDAHHCANVTFNMMRGGTPVKNYTIPGGQFAEFVRISNRQAAQRHAGLLNSLSGSVEQAELRDMIQACDDPVMDRLLAEYLPLTFSRRHGDPSRPWNQFDIKVRQPDGSPILAYQGNWRDIFQNWEALALSYPEFLEGMISKFVNASTLDGYNPYRITSEGLDWEEPDPDDPWAGIGYWGDHQITYLNKLLEWQEAFHPDSLTQWLSRERYVYTDVPYTIAPLEQILANPRETITFEAEKSRRIRKEADTFGSDAVLRRDENNQPACVSFLEKLLVPILVKLTNFVPGGGIWMNTQRPEWNDANNALVGFGLSMVTTSQLRRHLAFLEPVFRQASEQNIPISEPVIRLFQRVQSILLERADTIERITTSPGERAKITLALGTVGCDFRKTIYASQTFSKTALSCEQAADFCNLCLRWLDATIHTNLRTDGLYNSYNVLQYDPKHTRFDIHGLYPMLEGQVAVLSTGTLSAAETAALLQALRNSKMYRSDIDSYTLYPDRQLPGFLDKGVISPEQIEASALLKTLLEKQDGRLVERDRQGTVRFQSGLTTAGAAADLLTTLRSDPELGDLAAEEFESITDLYEQVFNHTEFTGRSGTMFGYEGLGSTYWHMVSKLLLAAQESCIRHEQDRQFKQLFEMYYQIRHGLGFNKSPQEYGAFPTDPYSHTPAKGGAKQPGMTGQVKEEIITRFGELGVRVKHGTLHFMPRLLRKREFLTQPDSFDFFDLHGEPASLPLSENELAFTFCQTPIIYQLNSTRRAIEVTLQNGLNETSEGLTLPKALSQSIFQRRGLIQTIRVFLTPDDLSA